MLSLTIVLEVRSRVNINFFANIRIMARISNTVRVMINSRYRNMFSFRNSNGLMIMFRVSVKVKPRLALELDLEIALGR